MTTGDCYNCGTEVCPYRVGTLAQCWKPKANGGEVQVEKSCELCGHFHDCPNPGRPAQACKSFHSSLEGKPTPKEGDRLIDPEGIFMVFRRGEWREVRCPFGSGTTFCRDTCAHFEFSKKGETSKENDFVQLFCVAGQGDSGYRVYKE
jgi:hypothetical protein